MKNYEKTNMPSKKSLKGHARFSMQEQAEKYVSARANRGKSKSSNATLRGDRTVLRYQDDLARAAKEIQKKYGITKLKDITEIQAQEYINQRRQENIEVSTLQGYAKALALLPQVKNLIVPSRITDKKARKKPTRAYTLEQIKEIQKNIFQPNEKLAIQVLLESGCRAKDLASICLESNRPVKNARLNKLHANRFMGRENWVKVTFIGKGGHEYASTISPETAQQLGLYRLASPRDFKERKQPNVVTKQFYDLPAGLKLSAIWSYASKKTFFKSRGLHGLRYSFAQMRLREMLRSGMVWDKALECVSQQMGHYRVSELKKTYLR